MGKLRTVANVLKRPAMLTGLVGGLGYVGDSLTNPETGKFDTNRLADVDEGLTRIAKNWSTPRQRNAVYDTLINGMKAVRGFDTGVLNLGRGAHSYVRSFSDPRQNYKSRINKALGNFAGIPDSASKFVQSLGHLGNSVVHPGIPDAPMPEPVSISKEFIARTGITPEEVKRRVFALGDMYATKRQMENAIAPEGDRSAYYDAGWDALSDGVSTLGDIGSALID